MAAMVCLEQAESDDDEKKTITLEVMEAVLSLCYR
jgi:hypothetical protein